MKKNEENLKLEAESSYAEVIRLDGELRKYDKQMREFKETNRNLLTELKKFPKQSISGIRRNEQ